MNHNLKVNKSSRRKWKEADERVRRERATEQNSNFGYFWNTDSEWLCVRVTNNVQLWMATEAAAVRLEKEVISITYGTTERVDRMYQLMKLLPHSVLATPVQHWQRRRQHRAAPTPNKHIIAVIWECIWLWTTITIIFMMATWQCSTMTITAIITIITIIIMTIPIATEATIIDRHRDWAQHLDVPLAMFSPIRQANGWTEWIHRVVPQLEPTQRQHRRNRLQFCHRLHHAQTRPK